MNDASTYDVVSITEAAKRLKCSVRTVQRRLDAGTLDAVEIEGQRRVKLSRDNATPNATSNALPNTTTRQNDATSGHSVARHDAKNATFGLKTNTIPRDSEGDTQRDKQGDVSRDNATGDAIRSAPAMQVLADVRAADARVIEVLERENAFLRLQIEAANRATAEAHAALREALKMSARALPPGELGQVGTEKADGVQVLAGVTAPNAPQSRGSASESPQTGAASANTSNPSKGREIERQRGFRGWLLQVLRG